MGFDLKTSAHMAGPQTKTPSEKPPRMADELPTSCCPNEDPGSRLDALKRPRLVPQLRSPAGQTSARNGQVKTRPSQAWLSGLRIIR